MKSTLLPSVIMRRAGTLLTAVICALELAPSMAKADNPIVQHVYTADPAPLVHTDASTSTQDTTRTARPGSR